MINGQMVACAHTGNAVRNSSSGRTWSSCCLPPYRNGVGILIHRFFEAQSPSPPIPLSTLQAPPRDVNYPALLLTALLVPIDGGAFVFYASMVLSSAIQWAVIGLLVRAILPEDFKVSQSPVRSCWDRGMR
jgi:hypothetical protein